MHRQTQPNGVVTYTFDTASTFETASADQEAGASAPLASAEGLFARPAWPFRAHVSTRHGGVSPAPWATLNFSVARGDTPERVQTNRQRFAEAVGVCAAKIVSCRQVHGTGVAKVEMSDAGTVQPGVDALITDHADLPLLLLFADCVPIVLYDMEHHALGICHAGWRGTVNGTATAALWAMQAAYGTRPEQVWAGIAPSIGPESYEVGVEVAEMAHAKLDKAERYFRYPNGLTGRPYFDLWQANAGQLAAAGVPQERIEIAGIDTAQTTDDFFSHRAEQGRCGLFGVMAWLVQEADHEHRT